MSYSAKLIRLFVVLFSFSLLGDGFSKPLEPLFKTKLKQAKVVENYLRVHQDFFKLSCSAKTEPHFNQLFRRFQKTRYLIPVDSNNQLDVSTVKYILPRLEQKISWIKKQQLYLEQQQDFKGPLSLIEATRLQIADHQRLKRKYALAKNYKQRSKYRKIAAKSRDEIRANISKLAEQIPFLLSFDFPVDHLKSRQLYDQLKERNDAEGNQQANQVYMERKLVEDGAQESDGSRNDLFVRSTFDTLYLGLSIKQDFISEAERYDLISILQSIEFHLKSGKVRLRKRLLEWQKRTEGTSQFYSHLFDKVQENNQSSELLAGKLLKKKAQSTYELKKYVSDKQAETYLFWAKQSELNRALFALETILFNEVGAQDPYQEERRDVTRLVINRQRIPFYSRLGLEDTLYYYLPNRYVNKEANYPWLSTLFKEGEFSFTYFYIPGSLRIFCPDMSKRGRDLRKMNLKIIADILMKPEVPFEGLRYFSRESMIGRIDMAKIWSQFESIAERPATRIRSKKLWMKYRKGQFDYLYHFEGDDGVRYEVVSIDNETWVIDPKRQRIYGHRNPHQFTYFRLKK